MGKLINRIPGLCLLISSLPGKALRKHVESLGKPRDVNKRFSKPCLVNLISKDTHLEYSLYLSIGNLPISLEVLSILCAVELTHYKNNTLHTFIV